MLSVCTILRLLRDKLSAFMESKGAASPGMLALTSYLSKVNPDLIISDYTYIHSYRLLV